MKINLEEARIYVRPGATDLRKGVSGFCSIIGNEMNLDVLYTMIFTSNKQPSQWKQNFCEDDSLLCALDRVFDDALIFNLRGNSYRGRNCESYSLTTIRGKATNADLSAPTTK